MESKDVVTGLETEYALLASDLPKSDDEELRGLITAVIQGWPNSFDNPFGGRIYQDQTLLEGDTPECAGDKAAWFLSLYMRVLDNTLLARLYHITKNRKPARKYHLLKGCTDLNGNWYGCQLNVRIPATLELEFLTEGLLPYQITKIIWAGKGGIVTASGLILPDEPDEIRFVFSPRAVSIGEIFSSTATGKTGARGFFCTKNLVEERSFDVEGWRRLEIIGNDSLQSDLVTYIDVGITLLIIRLLASSKFSAQLQHLPRLPRKPDEDEKKRIITELRQINQDPLLQAKLTLADGKGKTALEVQKKYLEILGSLADTNVLTAEETKILCWYRKILVSLEKRTEDLGRVCECWLTLTLAEEIMKRHGSVWDNVHAQSIKRKNGKSIPLSSYLLMLFHQTNALDDSWGIWPRYVREGRVEVMHNPEIIVFAETNPPPSRATARVGAFRLAKRFGVEARMDNDSWCEIIVNLPDQKKTFQMRDPTGPNDAIKKFKELIQ